jgi:uncharacterized protein (DUF305 family)
MHGTQASHYIHLLIMTVLMFVAMYVLMYAMVDRFGNVFNSLNQLYMAGLMTAPMVVIELALMGSMYENKKANLIIIVVSIVALAVFFTLIRFQTAVTDKQFLRSMIPHHAAAILMCEQAPIEDAEINRLCRTIIQSQQSEINQMKAKLNALDR